MSHKEHARKNRRSQGADSQKNLRYRTYRARKIGTYSENDVPNAWLKQSE